jgi:hypothetical protein
MVVSPDGHPGLNSARLNQSISLAFRQWNRLCKLSLSAFDPKNGGRSFRACGFNHAQRYTAVGDAQFHPYRRVTMSYVCLNSGTRRHKATLFAIISVLIAAIIHIKVEVRV